MEKIYVIGSGGFAKEVYFLIKTSTNFKVSGFIDRFNTSDHIKFGNEFIPIIDEDYFISNYKNENLCIGIGNPSIIKKIHSIFKDYNFPNIIHKSVIYDADNTKIGFGNILTAGCVFTTCLEIGNLNIFNLNTTLGHETIIGNYNIFNPSVNISGNCKIGDCNLMGVSSVVLENLKIGNNSILGANSTLIKDMEDNVIYVGTPAEYKKKNEIIIK